MAGPVNNSEHFEILHSDFFRNLDVRSPSRKSNQGQDSQTLYEITGGLISRGTFDPQILPNT